VRHPQRRGGSGIRYLIDRRDFIGASLGFLLWPLARSARAEKSSPLSPEVLRALSESPYVYVSPLRSDGGESRCHGEVWFAWIDGAVVVITGADRWKARSVRRGLDRARIWVGDFGRWKEMLGKNEKFRSGPSFDARAEFVEDAGVLDRLLKRFDEKYPAEIGKWRDRMRNGFADGSRVLIRYHPRWVSETTK
jgi:hypothetical protein